MTLWLSWAAARSKTSEEKIWKINFSTAPKDYGMAANASADFYHDADMHFRPSRQEHIQMLVYTVKPKV